MATSNAMNDTLKNPKPATSHLDDATPADAMTSATAINAGPDTQTEDVMNQMHA